jgi:hypothetical protein
MSKNIVKLMMITAMSSFWSISKNTPNDTPETIIYSSTMIETNAYDQFVKTPIVSESSSSLLKN